MYIFGKTENVHVEKSRIFTMGSDAEITNLMGSLSDDLLLVNEIAYVNEVWEKVNAHRVARKADTDLLRENFDKLKVF